MARIRFLAALLSTAAVPALAQSVTIDPSKVGAAVTPQILGMNMANWVDQTESGLANALHAGGIHATRWPGGSAADGFHWQTNSECNNGYVNPGATFGNFVGDVVVPAHLDLAVTLNYGSNAACNAGGDPTEAAAWVASAKANGDKVSHWTVGNEEYGSWEYDLHSKQHDAGTYATAVASGYYPDIKAANPSAKVGVLVNPGWSPAWDPTVLANAKYDFVEYHWYAQEPGQESDSYLVTQAPQAFASQIAALKSELSQAGHAATPIYVGELGSVAYNPGKQTSSITQALFAGQVLGELMNAGVSRATWWLGFGGCSDSGGGNFSSGLYGWQNFGGYMVFSDGTPEYGCSNATAVPRGTPLPTARAFQLFALVAHTGEHVLGSTLSDATGLIRAYALSHAGGEALVLFNLDQTNTHPITITVNGVATSSAVSVNTYDRALYDQSQNNVWAAPTAVNMGKQSLPLTLTLLPWSMNVVRIAK